MSYRKPRERHLMSVVSVFSCGERYATCQEPGCRHVRRARWARPLIHNGRKP
jgi:hypothetical protein